MQITAVVVTYNRLTKLRQTVQATLSQSVDRLIVVDNACTDGSAEWLASLDDPRLSVLRLPENIGGAGGFHHGFAAAIEDTATDWLVCYDDDAWPQEGAIDTFRAMTLPADVAGVAAAVYLPDGQISEMNRPSLNPFASLQQMASVALGGRMGFHVKDEAYAATGLTDIDYSSFVGCFLRAPVIRDRLGLPRAELFIYADDIIYTFGIRQQGLRHVFAPMVKFTHDCGTLQGQQDIYKPLWRAFYSYRNRLELFRIVSGRLFPLVLLIKLPGWVLKARHYDQPWLFLDVLRRAVSEGVRRDFSRSHAQVRELCEK